MRGTWWVLLMLAALLDAPARADVVVLVDGRVLHGTAAQVDEVVVVRQRFGETRVPRDAVRSIITDVELARRVEAEQAKRAADAEQAKRELLARADRGAPPPPPSRLAWEPDAERAAQLAAAQRKLVLTSAAHG